MSAGRTLFISHTHSDRRIADAIRDAVHDLFRRRVTVHYSTNQQPEGGIDPGEEWFRWIVGQVRDATVTLVLLTPASVQKPWILWEAGAVAGAEAASRDESRPRRVRPIVFQLEQSEVPSPFHNVQTLRGDRADDARRLFRDLRKAYDGVLEGSEVMEAGERLADIVSRYMETVENALLNAPLVATEATIQEWCARLDELRERNRMSEVAPLHGWLNIAFGRERDKDPRPLDVRIHRRLGQLYLDSRQYGPAAAEFRLARRLSPRDLYVLRALGQALLKDGRRDETGEVLAQIEALDADAFAHNAECAALKGGYLEAASDFTQAQDVYRAALQRNHTSYYLADKLGQAALETGDHAAVKYAYERALKIIRELDEENVWIHATAATAAAATGEHDEVLKRMHAVDALNPTDQERSSIEGGLRRVQEALVISRDDFERWTAALYGR